MGMWTAPSDLDYAEGVFGPAELDVMDDNGDLCCALQRAEWERSRADDAERQVAALTVFLRELQTTLEGTLARVRDALDEGVSPF